MQSIVQPPYRTDIAARFTRRIVSHEIHVHQIHVHRINVHQIHVHRINVHQIHVHRIHIHYVVTNCHVVFAIVLVFSYMHFL